MKTASAHNTATWIWKRPIGRSSMSRDTSATPSSAIGSSQAFVPAGAGFALSLGESAAAGDWIAG
ncbi:MAG TPA: hypothetical protein VN681_09010 [Stellaceae bacterium]|nr:hypothetical protein [Stellaceae bacterium]